MSRLPWRCQSRARLVAARSSNVLASCRRDLQGLAQERLRFLDRIAVHVEENLGPQPVELRIVEVLSLLLGLRDTESERAQSVVVAPDLPEALGELAEVRRRPDPASDLSQLDHRLLHLRDARLALPRFDPRPASQNPPQSQPERKPELLGETHKFSGAFPRSAELAALEMDNSSKQESVRQAERMFHALRQCHRRLAQRQRPVGMATVHVTPGRIRVSADATVKSQRVRQRPMRAGIV